MIYLDPNLELACVALGAPYGVWRVFLPGPHAVLRSSLLIINIV